MSTFSFFCYRFCYYLANDKSMKISKLKFLKLKLSEKTPRYNLFLLFPGESSEKKLFEIPLDSKTQTELDISKVSTKGAWKLTCNEKQSTLLLYVKHTNDLHLYKDSQHVCQVQCPFSGQVSQLEMTSSYIVVGLLEKHVVQVRDAQIWIITVMKTENRSEHFLRSYRVKHV